ncbi:MAG: M20/M25/M40 family metallo-hydrolase [Brevinematales bacterium]|nr:M20/M25/M40 family metallo-hydrolase [Brevinematales bacterium]
MYQMLRLKNDGIKKELIDFTKRLISTESTSLHEENVAEIVKNEMKLLGYDNVFIDGAGNVIGIIYGTDKENSILLSSHMDTVADGDAEGWNHDPYQAMEKAGRIYGRGASDCKGGLAAQVYAGALLKRSLLPLKGNLIVAAVVAEENGLSLGTRFLLSETLPSLKMQPGFAILGEPTEQAIYYGHDGWLEMDITLEGSNVFELDDAVQTVANEMNEGFTAREWEQYAYERNESEILDGDSRTTLRFRSKMMMDENPKKLVSWVRKRVTSAVKNAASVAVNIFLKGEEQTLYTGRTEKVQFSSSGWMTDPFHPMIERAYKSITAGGSIVRRGKWLLDKPGMGTSGGVYLNEYDIPVMGYGPGSEEEAHAVNESVEIEKLADSVYGNAVMAHGMIGVPVYGWTIDEI